MGVLIVVTSIAAAVGLAAAALVRRWPTADPAATTAREVGHELRKSGRLRRFLRARLRPATVTDLALTVALLGILVVGIAVGVIVYMIRTNSGFVRFDAAMADWAALHMSATSEIVLKALTSLGSTPVVIAAALVASAYVILRWRATSVLVFFVLVVGGQFLLSNVIKFGVDRVRPAVDQLTSSSGPSFPSGHAMASAATYAAVALVLGRGLSPWARSALAGVAVTIAVAVASSRVLLGVHWFSDVLAGLALGWLWFWIVAVAFGGRLLRFGAPADAATSGQAARELVRVSGSGGRADSGR